MTSSTVEEKLPSNAKDLLSSFEKKTGLSNLRTSLLNRPDGDYLVIYLANPTERLFSILNQVESEVVQDSFFSTKVTLKKSVSENLLQSSETRLFLKSLAESLTASRYSFQEDFFSRYITSVSGAEDKIVAAAHHIVYGRRGAGKSSLLLYAMHRRESPSRISVWIDMQVYAHRQDLKVVTDVIHEIIHQIISQTSNPPSSEHVLRELKSLTGAIDEPSEQNIRNLFPDIKRLLSSVSQHLDDIFIFLDDLHLLDICLQPRLLDFIYAFARGNKVFLKLSAIETFTKLWDPGTRTGLERPHDIQQIELDYNLTMTDRATTHITSILNSRALYCGLPSIHSLCRDKEVLSRLVWVAAGVPRDAINIFSQALSKASFKDQKKVNITNINESASELVSDKLQDIELDSSGSLAQANILLGRIREFCVKNKRMNAFLVEELHGDPAFTNIKRLIDLRLLHVIHEGITIREAGKKHLALILDYGFYIGIRAARSVQLFNKQTTQASYDEFRRLPVFTLANGDHQALKKSPDQ
ncbi:MAG: hypothetical protein RLZZ609_1565 [Cyanobacteriota bacterium]|jgi:hypothetical protein